MDIEKLIKQPESTTLEFKENINSIDRILSCLIAFANTSGGQMIIGINDEKRSIVGVDEPEKIVDTLANKIDDVIQPKLFPEIIIKPYRSTYIVIIDVSPSNVKPHYKKSERKQNITYVRSGASTRQAGPDWIRAIEQVKMKNFDEQLCNEAIESDVDKNRLIEAFLPDRKLSQDDMVSIGVFAKNGRSLLPTNTGILLFGANSQKFFPEAFVKIAAFEGVDRLNIIDQQSIKSLSEEGVEQALNFLKRHMNVATIIDDIKNREVWLVPKIALREAIINAIVHNDYTLREPIRIGIYSDRIEIENSALLMGGVTIEDLQKGNCGSRLHNRNIARIFHELKLIEQWGTGIGRMISLCNQAGLKRPEFEQGGSRIKVTFFMQRKEVEQNDDAEEVILGLLAFCGSLSTRQIAECMDLSRRTIVDKLNKLVNLGKVFEVSQNKNDPMKLYTIIDDQRRSRMYEIFDNKISSQITVRVSFIVNQYYIDFVFDKIDTTEEAVRTMMIDEYFCAKIILKNFRESMSDKIYNLRRKNQWYRTYEIKISPSDYLKA